MRKNNLLLTGLAITILCGCAGMGKPVPDMREHPKLQNKTLSSFQSEILGRHHPAFASYIQSRSELPAGCRPPQSRLWEIAAPDGMSPEKFKEDGEDQGGSDLVLQEVDAVITHGDCDAPGASARPYTAESVFRYVSTYPTVDITTGAKVKASRPSTVKGKEVVTQHDGEVRHLRLSRSDDRYSYSLVQGDYSIHIDLPLEEPSESATGIDIIYTTVSQPTRTDKKYHASYYGSVIVSEWWSLNGQEHGKMIMHPHRIVSGPGGKVPGGRHCFQHGEKAPLSACGMRQKTESSGAGAAAILGGLAATAAAGNAGLSESSSVDMGVRVARDIERGELSTDTYNAAQSASVSPSRDSTMRAARQLAAASETTDSSGARPTSGGGGQGATQAHQSSNRQVRETGASSDPAYLRYTSHQGVDRALPVDKSARAEYEGLYANEHRDPAAADFRYRLNGDGTARLEHKPCENCTHGLSGSALDRTWTEQYVAIEWAPMLTESGQPMTRQITDMNGVAHEARVLVVILEGGRTMSLNYYIDGGRAALSGPYGVPRYRQD